MMRQLNTLLTAAVVTVMISGCTENGPSRTIVGSGFESFPQNLKSANDPTFHNDVIDDPDPLSIIDAHFESLTEQQFQTYADLLENGFRWYVRPEDEPDLPWISDGYWGRETELEIIQNLFDDNFQGSELPVETIDAAYTVVNVRPLESGIREVTCDATILVLVGPNDGWITDTRLVITLALQPRGTFKIRQIREVSILITSLAEESSWSLIKSLYR